MELKPNKIKISNIVNMMQDAVCLNCSAVRITDTTRRLFVIVMFL